MTLFLVWRLFCTLLFHRIHFVTKKDNLLQVLLKQIVKVTFDQVLSVNLQKKVLEKAAVSGIFVKIDFWLQVIFHLQHSVSFSPPYILSIIRILPLIYLIPICLLTSLVRLVPPYSPLKTFHPISSMNSSPPSSYSLLTQSCPSLHSISYLATFFIALETTS